MSKDIQFGIIAALEHEIAPLVRGWRVEQIAVNGQPYKAYVTEDAVLMLAGMGSAWTVTKVLIETYAPKVLISTGFAGALTSAVRVPAVFIPRDVVSEETGAGFRCAVGVGRLVTTARVANGPRKRHLAECFEAQAVDMEAAQVAEVAEARGCRFLAIKAISDDLDTDISFVSRFVAGQQFRTAAFVSYIAVRPWLWSAVRELKQSSEAARRNLCELLASIIKRPAEFESILTAAVEPTAMQLQR